jgi:tRNA threonylcarbamoyladenosine biosynthesis protein TsaE
MPILDANSLELFSNSADQSRRIGVQLGSLLQHGDVLCLEGELGAGKTTFSQGLVAGWGSSDQVTSPTFVLLNIYSRADGSQLNHMDAYRLDLLSEAKDLDLESYMAQGPIIIEWAERVEALLPKERIWVNLYHVAEERRRIEISPQGDRYLGMMAKFQESVYGLT